MRNCIGRVFEPLVRVLRPGRGRHRTVGTRQPVDCADAPTLQLPRVHKMSRKPVLRSEDVQLVRPYLVAHERRKDVPRVELLCAPHGMAVVR
ncbi:hypothetical protein GCM10022420_006920 [Streptomyces iranensis]